MCAEFCVEFYFGVQISYKFSLKFETANSLCNLGYHAFPASFGERPWGWTTTVTFTILSSLLCLVCATLHLIIKQKAFDRSSKFCFFTPQGSRIPGVALLTGKPPPQGHPTASNSQVSLEPKWPCRGFCWPPFVEPENLLQILFGCLALPCGLWLHSWFRFCFRFWFCRPLFFRVFVFSRQCSFVFAFGFVALRSFAFSVFRASFEKVGKFGPNFMSPPVCVRSRLKVGPNFWQSYTKLFGSTTGTVLKLLKAF